MTEQGADASFDAVAESLWRRARDLGDTPTGQWTFPILVNRGAITEPNGLALAYEALSTWEQVTQVLNLVNDLVGHGVPHAYLYYVNLGLEIYDGAYYAKSGNLRPPRRGEPFRGRHAVGVYGVDRDRLVFQNTWGPRWGDGGSGYISRQYFEAHVDLALASRRATFGPSNAMTTELTRRRWRAGRFNQGPSTSELAEAWLTPCPITSWTVDHDAGPLTLAARTLKSIKGATMHIMEARALTALIGRAHLHHYSDGRSVAEEFWVAPSARRTGYGQLLLRASEILARQEGSRSLRLVLHEADALPAGRARAFADCIGYRWTPTEQRRPNLLAFVDGQLVGG
jgi:GNAT superfamily N-acetyltransferase